MASFNERSAVRPASSQRPPSTSSPMNVPARSGASRSHAHSTSLSTLNSSHRVSRRKSMNTNGTTSVAATIRAMNEASLEAIVSPPNRAHLPIGGMKRAESSSTIRPGSSYVTHLQNRLAVEGGGTNESAISDDTLPDKNIPSTKQKVRRASEGAYLSKGEGKRVAGELRCETCGKGYKHSSCLTKHLWEHTPEWSYTSKLLISKHQQVQLLEAASVLMQINQDMVVESDHSSASPAVSGSSDNRDDDISSIETSPPPVGELEDFTSESYDKGHMRHSSTSSVFSQSYQSGPSASFAGSIPTAASYNSYRPLGHSQRLSHSSVSYHGMTLEDDAGLAAAVELCHFGTPRTCPTQLEDIPPVPPLPAQYASYNTIKRSSNDAYADYKSDLRPTAGLTHRISDERYSATRNEPKKPTEDVRMANMHEESSKAPHDDYDEGVFGTMEE